MNNDIEIKTIAAWARSHRTISTAYAFAFIQVVSAVTEDSGFGIPASDGNLSIGVKV